MSSFHTDGRLALIEALQDDTAITALVKTWYEFGPGLRKRRGISPAACPAISIMPAEGSASRVANVEREVPQRLRIEVATDGQDAAPCEELVALVMACVEAANDGCLGLAADGLTGLRVRSMDWTAVPHADGARILWTASVDVELLWRLL